MAQLPCCGIRARSWEKRGAAAQARACAGRNVEGAAGTKTPAAARVRAGRLAQLPRFSRTKLFDRQWVINGRH